MEQLGTSDGKPAQPIKIVDCGEISKAKSQHTVEKEKGICDGDRYRWICYKHSHLKVLPVVIVGNIMNCFSFQGKGESQQNL